MNGGKFGFIPFAGNASRRKGFRSVSYRLDLSSTAGIGLHKTRLALCRTALNTQAAIINNWPRIATFPVSLKSSAEIIRVHRRAYISAAELSTSISLSKNEVRFPGFLSALESDVALSKHEYRNICNQTELNTYAELNTHSLRALGGYGILNAYVSIGTYTTETMTLNVTMPPGSRLVVDTENYTAYLDSVNVIDKHLEDGWIWLSRDLIELIVDAAVAGNFDGSVTFKERSI